MLNPLQNSQSVRHHPQDPTWLSVLISMHRSSPLMSLVRSCTGSSQVWSKLKAHQLSRLANPSLPITLVQHHHQGPRHIDTFSSSMSNPPTSMVRSMLHQTTRTWAIGHAWDMIWMLGKRRLSLARLWPSTTLQATKADWLWRAKRKKVNKLSCKFG